MRTWRHFLLVVVLAIGGGLVTGCGGEKGRPCEGTSPGNGGESEPCANSDQCDGQMYCNLTRCICFPPHECIGVADCENPDNVWTHDTCAGHAACNAGLCEWICD